LPNRYRYGLSRHRPKDAYREGLGRWLRSTTKPFCGAFPAQNRVTDSPRSAPACIASTKVELGQDRGLFRGSKFNESNVSSHARLFMCRRAFDGRAGPGELPQGKPQAYRVPKLSSAFQTVSKPLNHSKSNCTPLMFP